MEHWEIETSRGQKLSPGTERGGSMGWEAEHKGEIRKLAN